MTEAGTPIEALLASAHQRALSGKLSYQGVVTPTEAWELMQDKQAHLIDVRSAFEWEYVGHIPGSTLVEWKHLPGGEFNVDFLSQLAEVGGKSENYLFLCRSGARSHAAATAAAAAGYRGAFNILEGFEGDLDAHKQRGKTGGWRHAGLPWVQG